MRTFNIESRYVHMKDAVVNVSQYADGSPALIAEATDEEGYPDQTVLSVNLSAYGANPLPEGQFYVPDYSEHEGVPDALVVAGIGTIVERFTFGPFDTAGAIIRLTEEVSA